MAYDVNIGFVANGWVAKVGCQTFVFLDPEVLLSELREYLTDPNTKTEQVTRTARNMRWTGGGLAPEPCAPSPPTAYPSSIDNSRIPVNVPQAATAVRR